MLLAYQQHALSDKSSVPPHSDEHSRSYIQSLDTRVWDGDECHLSSLSVNLYEI